MAHTHTVPNKTLIPSVRAAAGQFAKNLLRHNVARNAASLAYYFIFAIFPISIFLNNMLGLMDLDIGAIIHALRNILPAEAVSLLEDYLQYVSSTSSKTLLYFSLIFSIWFPMKAVNGLMDDVRRAYSLGKPEKPVYYTLRQFAYTLLLLAVLSLSLPLTILGKQVLYWIYSLLPFETTPLDHYILILWQYLRFVPAALLMLLALCALYEAAMDRPMHIKTQLPGIFAALAVWLGVSILFSYYVENFANYSLIYGTLGAVIMLLVWLYMTALILIMGSELNAAILTVRAESEQLSA